MGQPAVLKTPAKFKAWLQAKGPDVVGYRALSDKCALTFFLRAQGKHVEEVTPDAIVMNRRQYETPEWCQAFIGCFDFGTAMMPVSGTDALIDLQDALQEVGVRP